MSDFRTLNLAIEFHDQAERLEIKGHLRDQLLRAASSIALNLSEGNAKPSFREKKRYYHTAYASCQECKTLFLLAKIKDQPINRLAEHLGASLFKLMKADLRVFAEKNLE